MVRIELVKIDEIKPNDYNPNKMPRHVYETLVNNIKATKALEQPILVTMDYTIIDGEHRWKASKDAGLDEVHVVVSESLDEEAKLKTISFNHIRGEYDEEEFIELLSELSDAIDYEHIANQTSLFLSDIKQMMGSYENIQIADSFASDIEKEMGDESDYLGLPEIEEPVQNIKPKAKAPIKQYQTKQPSEDIFESEPVEIDFLYEEDEPQESSHIGHTVQITEPEESLSECIIPMTDEQRQLFIKGINYLKNNTEDYEDAKIGEIVSYLIWEFAEGIKIQKETYKE